MGKKLVLQGVKLTGPDAPVLPDIDPIESVGSLMLVEPAHPHTQWASGVPADGAAVPNVLAEKAVAFAGPDTDHAIASSLNNINDGVAGVLERTSKGGLHVIFSPTQNGEGTRNAFHIDPGPGVAQYIVDNPHNHFYMSFWVNVTRMAKTVAGQLTIAQICRDVSAASNWKMLFFRHGFDPTGSLSEFRVDQVTGPQIGTNHATTFNGSPPIPPVGVMARMFLVGNSSGFNTLGSRQGASPSMILYRAYIEDLTVSGRSYEQVDAIDNALFTEQVLTPGGRYHGDTFTDPTTVP